MQTVQMTITPAIAKAWLTKNTDNRSVKERHVSFLANEIKKGAWRVTHQGIAFSKSDVLLDGQHRLLAIVSAGVSVDALVTFGVEDDAMGVIDGAAVPRTLSDRLKLSGNDSWVHLRTSVAVFNCLTSTVGKKLSISDIEKLAEMMSDDCVTIFKKYGSCSKLRSITTAPIFASIVLFVYHNPKKLDVALRFMHILTTGEYDAHKKGELTAIKYRHHLMANGQKYQTGSSMRFESMKICQYALMKFSNGIDVVKMQFPEDEIYPRITL